MYVNAHLISSTQAAGHGDFASAARQMRDALADEMTPEQIAAAIRLTHEFRDRRAQCE